MPFISLKVPIVIEPVNFSFLNVLYLLIYPSITLVFVNVVDPYLRDIKTKRGVTDYLIVCDETNNTPEVIDNNEFRADIFLKPTKSINYVTLTFVATRTGISFEEVTGRV